MSNNEMKSLYVVSEHLMFGYGLENLLHQSQTEAKVVGYATDVDEAAEQLRLLRPDIVILYSHKPMLAGVSLATRLLELFPTINVISMSVDDNTMYCYQAAQHYIESIEDLVHVINNDLLSSSRDY